MLTSPQASRSSVPYLLQQLSWRLAVVWSMLSHGMSLWKIQPTLLVSVLIIFVVMVVSPRLYSSRVFTLNWTSLWTHYIWTWLSWLFSDVSSWAQLGKQCNTPPPRYLSWIMLMLLSAFNAIVSASVVLLDISYAIPIAVNCARGRRMLPERSFNLPDWFGWTINIVRHISRSLCEDRYWPDSLRSH